MTPVVFLVFWFNLQVQQAEVMLGQGQHVLAVAVLSGGYEQLGCEGVPLEEVRTSRLAALTDCKKRVGRGIHMPDDWCTHNAEPYPNVAARLDWWQAPRCPSP